MAIVQVTEYGQKCHAELQRGFSIKAKFCGPFWAVCPKQMVLIGADIEKVERTMRFHKEDFVRVAPEYLEQV